jgi:ubiquinone biosynthesis protein
MKAMFSRRYFKRTREILTLIIAYGFGQFIEGLKLAKFIKISSKIVSFGKYKVNEAVSDSIRFRLLIEQLGPTFIKIGQFLQTKPQLLPQEFINELRKLSDKVSPRPFSEIRQTLERTLGSSIGDVFDYVEETATASASIAQVHRAKLKNGSVVALKIKKVGITKTINIDLSIIKWLVAFFQKYFEDAYKYNFIGIAQEFADQLQKELDFILEANYMREFKKFFKHNANIIIPGVYWEYTTDELITMDYCDGVAIDSINILKSNGFDTDKIASLSVDLYLKQVFEFGFFHGDPHPGNFLVNKEGKIIMLDFGVIGHVDKLLLKHLSKVFIALIDFNIDELLSEFIAFGIISKKNDLRKIRGDLIDLLLPVYDVEIEKIDITKLFYNIIALNRKYLLNIPRDYLLIIKTFSFLENTGRKLSPEFNAIKYLRPYASKIILSNYKPEELVNKTLENAKELASLLKRLPDDYIKIADKVIEDNLTINFVHKGLDKFTLELDRATNRLSFSILIGAIILGSSIFIYTGFGPKLFNIPVFGLIGFLFAGILGLGLVFAILKTGRL